jgi:hypothetical protein
MKIDLYSIARTALLTFSFTFLLAVSVYAQKGREVDGTVIDSTKLSIPGATVKLISDGGDSTIVVTDGNGKFVVPSVNGKRFTLTIASLGYQTLKRRYVLDTASKPAVLDPIVLKSDAHLLSGVTIIGVNPIALKEDTGECARRRPDQKITGGGC